MKNLFLILVMLTLNFTDKTVHSDGHVEIVWETEKFLNFRNQLFMILLMTFYMFQT